MEEAGGVQASTPTVAPPCGAGEGAAAGRAERAEQRVVLQGAPRGRGQPPERQELVFQREREAADGRERAELPVTAGRGGDRRTKKGRDGTPK